jgi:hypothetical protein
MKKVTVNVIKDEQEDADSAAPAFVSLLAPVTHHPVIMMIGIPVDARYTDLFCNETGPPGISCRGKLLSHACMFSPSLY